MDRRTGIASEHRGDLQPGRELVGQDPLRLMFALLARPGSFLGSTAGLRHGRKDPGGTPERPAAVLVQHCGAGIARERVLGRSLRPQRTFWRSRRYG